jgi:plasmid maintenance system killer protein
LEILFKDKSFGEDCIDSKKLRKRYGKVEASKISQRLDDILAAPNLKILGQIFPRVHELIGDKKGLISLDLNGQWRLIVEPADIPPSIKSDGGLDWENIKIIRVLGIYDTH